MGLNRLTGTPWHLERYARKDGDLRRHRSKCAYYHKSESYCAFYFEKCHGSAHCATYTEHKKKSVLTVGANKKTEASKSDTGTGFEAGCRVSHSIFGCGTVKCVSSDIITIIFDSGSEKRLSLNTCITDNLLKIAE